MSKRQQAIPKGAPLEERRWRSADDVIMGESLGDVDDSAPRAPSSVSKFRPSSRTVAVATAAMTPRNPFFGRERDNFPDFDIALKPGSPCVGLGSSTEEEEEEDDLVDQSVFSEGGTSSILNMSIGARAALNEHLRHVAKYGIDGEKAHEGSGVDEDHREFPDHGEEEDDQSPGGATDALLDQHWENLLDISSHLNSSGEAGSIVGASGRFLEASHLQRHEEDILYNASLEDYGADSIEVMTDISNDFFNSSRVNLLTTPERNQYQRGSMVVTRDDEPVETLPFQTPSSAVTGIRHPGDTDSSGEGLGVDDPQNTSGMSFNPGDISRISEAGSTTFRPSPDTSFLFQEAHHPVDLDVSLIAPAGASSSPQSSFLSDHDNRHANVSFAYGKGDFTPPRPAAQNTVPAARHKENISPETSNGHSSDSKNQNSSVQSVVSTFFDEARSMVAYVSNELETSFGALETLPADFLRAMDFSGGDERTPSPISHNSSSQESAKRKVEHSTNVHPSSRLDYGLMGRKRFRTVVPRRIYNTTTFLEAGEEEGEDEQDSFLAVRSNPETTRNDVEVSLGESVEERAMRTTF